MLKINSLPLAGFFFFALSTAQAAVVNNTFNSQKPVSEVWKEVSRNLKNFNYLTSYCSTPLEIDGNYVVSVDLYSAGVNLHDMQIKVIKGHEINSLVLLVLNRYAGGINVMSSSISLSKPILDEQMTTKVDDDILKIIIPIKREYSDQEQKFDILPELRSAQQKMQELLKKGVVWDTTGSVKGHQIDATIAQIDVGDMSYTRSSDAYAYNIIINSPQNLVIYDSVSDQKMSTAKDENSFKTYLIGTDEELAQYYDAGKAEINGESCEYFKSELEGGELCISDRWGIPIYRKNVFWKYEQYISNIGVGGVKMNWFDIPSSARGN